MKSAAALAAALLVSTASAQKPPLQNYKCTAGDCKSGFGKQEHPSGFKYEGEFQAGARVGLGVETMPGGVRYAGNFADNSANGLGVMLFPDGRLFAGEWQNEYPHGCGLSVEVNQPDETLEMKMTLRHTGRWAEGEMSEPEADCHVEINQAHEAARKAIEASGSDPYVYEKEGPRKKLSKEEEVAKLENMQQSVLQLISLVSTKASEEKMEEVEELSETLHGLEITFVKMYYSKKSNIGDAFKPLFSRDALETVIFETMLEIDESTLDDTSYMEEQLAFMEEDLENFPSEDEQNIVLFMKHIKLTEHAIAQHKADGDDVRVAEASEHLASLQQQVADIEAKMAKDQASNVEGESVAIPATEL